MRAIVQLIAIVSFAGTAVHGADADLRRQDTSRGGAQGLGILMGAIGFGALGGALLMASRTALKGFTVWIPCAAAAFALSLAGFAISNRMWLSCLMLFLSGFALMIQVGASNTLIQSMVPDHLRGRAMSVYSMMYIGVGPLGAMVAGFVADGLGARWTILAGASDLPRGQRHFCAGAAGHPAGCATVDPGAEGGDARVRNRLSRLRFASLTKTGRTQKLSRPLLPRGDCLQVRDTCLHAPD